MTQGFGRGTLSLWQIRSPRVPKGGRRCGKCTSCVMLVIVQRSVGPLTLRDYSTILNRRSVPEGKGDGTERGEDNEPVLRETYRVGGSREWKRRGKGWSSTIFWSETTKFKVSGTFPSVKVKITNRMSLLDRVSVKRPLLATVRTQRSWPGPRKIFLNSLGRNSEWRPDAILF